MSLPLAASATIAILDCGIDLYAAVERAYAELMAHLQESPVIDWTHCPEVEIVPGKVNGVPILKHSRMPADAIVENHASGLAADEIAEVFQLPAEGVRQLLAHAVKRNPALFP